MLSETFARIFERDLNKLKNEIGQYETDDALWTVRGEVKNSGGNLTLHIVGNLNHFIGAALDGNGFVRDRDSEFASTGISREELISRVDNTIPVVTAALERLSDDDFEKDFPVPIPEKAETTAFALIHLLGHFSYHLGQVNYHRRLTS